MSDLKLFGQVGLGIDKLKEDVKNIGTILNSVNKDLKKLEDSFQDTANTLGTSLKRELTDKQKNAIQDAVRAVEDGSRQILNKQKQGYDREVKAFEEHQRKITNIRSSGNKFKNLGKVDSVTFYTDADDKMLRAITKYTDMQGRQITLTRQLNEEEGKLEVKTIRYHDNIAKKLRETTALEKKLQQEREKAQAKRDSDANKYYKQLDRQLAQEEKAVNSVSEAIALTLKKRRQEQEKLAEVQARYINKSLEQKYLQQQKELEASAKATVKFEQEKQREAEKTAKSYLKQAQAQKGVALSSGSAFGRRAGHLFDYGLIAGSAFMAQKAIRETIKANKEFEVGQINLQRILRATADEMGYVKDMTFEISKATGNATKDIQDIQNLWIRTGRQNLNELKELTQITAVGLNVAEFKSAEESVSFLNSAINQMANGDWTKAQEILDSWAKTADTTAVRSTEDLAEMIARAGSQAKQLGLDFHDLNAVTGILAERMAITGDVAGTAMKTIFGRFQNESNIKKLRELGIEIQKVGQDGFLTFREFPNIMDDLNTKFKELRATDNLAELSKIEEILGGTRMRAVIGNLIEGWDRYDEIVTSSINSSGFAMEQNEQIMQTYSKQLEALKANLAELALNIGEAGLMDALRWLSQGTSEAVSWFNDLDPYMRNVISTAMIMTTAFGALNLTVKRTTQLSIVEWANKVIATKTGILDLSRSFEMLNSLVEAGNISTQVRAEVISVLKGKTDALRVSEEARNLVLDAQALATTKATALTKGLSAGFSMLLAVIPIAIGLISSYNRSMEERSRKQQESIKATSDELDKLYELKTEMQRLTPEVDTNYEAKKRLLAIQRELAELYPNLATGIDNEGKAIADNLALTEKEIEAKERLLEIELRGLEASMSKKAPELEKERVKLEKEIAEINQRFSSGNLYDMRESTGEMIDVTDKLNNSLVDKIARLREIDAEEKKLAKTTSTLNDIENKRLVRDLKQQAVNATNAVQLESIERQAKSLGLTQAQVNDVMGRATEVSQGYFNNMGDWVEDLEDLGDAMPIIEGLTNKFNEQIEVVAGYTTLLNELNSKEGLSAKSKQEIATKYQQLLPYINNEKALREKLIEAIDKERAKQKEAYSEMLMNSNTYFTEVSGKHKEYNDLINRYRIKDLEGAKNFADAKELIETQLISRLSGKWAKFYNIVGKSVTPTGAYESLARGAIMGDPNAQRIYNEIRAERSAYEQAIKDTEDAFKKLVGDNEIGGFKMSEFTDTPKSKSKNELPKGLQNIIDKLEHDSKMDRIDSWDYADKLEKALNQYKSQLNQKAIWDLEEKIYSLRKTGAKERGYKAIDFKELQADLNALDKELTLLEKQESFLETVNTNKSQLMETYNLQIKNYERQLKEMNVLQSEYAKQLQNVNNKINSLSPATIGYDDIMKELIKDKETLTEEMHKNSVAMEDNKIAIEKAKLAMEDLIKVYRDEYIKTVKEARSKEVELYNNGINAISEMESKVIAIIKKRGELEKEALRKSHEYEMELLEKSHKAKLDSYKEELEKFRLKVQGEIDLLEEQYAEEDYLENLSKEREKANALQKQIDTLSMDDSLTARTKATELRKQLAEQNDKIVKMQQKKERDTIKKSLQDQIKDKESSIKAQESLETNSYETTKETMEKAYKANQEALDKQYEDYMVYIEAKKAIDTGYVTDYENNMIKLEDAYVKFEDRFGAGMGILGNKIKDDFIRQLEVARDALDNLYQNRSGEFTDDYSKWTDSDWDKHLSSDKNYQPPSLESYKNHPLYNKWIGLNNLSIEQLQERYQSATAQLDSGNFSGASKEQLVELLEAYNRFANLKRNKGFIVTSQAHLKKYGWDGDIRGYSEGGKIDYTGLAMVHGRKSSPEWMFNDGQLKKTIREITLKTINTVKPDISNLSHISSVYNQYDINLSVEGNLDRSILPEVKEMIETSISKAQEKQNIILNKKGIFRPAR